jgi:RP/EB family microtubule-associated protein
MDAILPGRMPLQKVNFDARLEYEYTKNYKVLTTFFENNSIDKTVDVQRLIKGKYQDNLEFLQWIKRYYDIHANQEDIYNAAERRENSRASKAANRANARPPAVANAVARKPAVAPAPSARTAAAAAAAAAAAPAPRTSVAGTVVPPLRQAAPARGSAAGSVPVSAAQRQVAELTRELASMQKTLDELEKERDFYFSKLRAVEIVCQDLENAQPGLAKPVLDVLYNDDAAAPAAPAGAAAAEGSDEENEISVNM